MPGSIEIKSAQVKTEKCIFNMRIFSRNRTGFGLGEDKASKQAALRNECAG
jgi:hypothetical protein